MMFDEACECGKTFLEHHTFSGFEVGKQRIGLSYEGAGDGYTACPRFRRRLTPDERQEVLVDILRIREGLS